MDHDGGDGVVMEEEEEEEVGSDKSIAVSELPVADSKTESVGP